MKGFIGIALLVVFAVYTFPYPGKHERRVLAIEQQCAASDGQLILGATVGFPNLAVAACLMPPGFKLPAKE